VGVNVYPARGGIGTISVDRLTGWAGDVAHTCDLAIGDCDVPLGRFAAKTIDDRRVLNQVIKHHGIPLLISSIVVFAILLCKIGRNTSMSCYPNRNGRTFWAALVHAKYHQLA
jgi:hypothetical protein